ncbi:MAG: ParE family toxin-like protein [Gammaproteobacteria bacterium]
MNHHAAPEYWYFYRALPAQVRELADRCFGLMKANPRHPSIQLKKVGEYWVARVGLHYRALGIDVSDGISWFWIGTHAEYDKIVG